MRVSNAAVYHWIKSKVVVSGHFENFKWPHLCMGDPIHSMFDSRVRFSGSAD